MRRIWICALLAALALLALAGCEGSGGKGDPDWDEDWVQLAGYVGIEPVDGFTLDESNDTLSVSGLYYAAWTSGEGQAFSNAEGKEATVYDAQIYVLLEECRSAEAAGKAVGEWTAREEETYEVGETETKTFGTQDFALLPLLSGSEDNPYTHGTAAFAVRDKWALSVELMCTDNFTGDSRALLEDFLTGFHYSGEVGIDRYGSLFSGRRKTFHQRTGGGLCPIPGGFGGQFQGVFPGGFYHPCVSDPLRAGHGLCRPDRQLPCDAGRLRDWRGGLRSRRGLYVRYHPAAAPG